MRKCNKPIGLAKSGVDRGFCSSPAGHRGPHGNKTCPHCGEKLTVDNSSPSVRRNSGRCTKCSLDLQRKRLGQEPARYQVPGQKYTFPCGCSGILPNTGESNMFAMQRSSGNHRCRVAHIINMSGQKARIGRHAPIPPNTPHSDIRELMLNLKCTMCGEVLDWTNLGLGKTPHLDHSHSTGEILGFTHAKCNPHALEVRVRQEVVRVRQLEAKVIQLEAKVIQLENQLQQADQKAA